MRFATMFSGVYLIMASIILHNVVAGNLHDVLVGKPTAINNNWDQQTQEPKNNFATQFHGDTRKNGVAPPVKRLQVRSLCSTEVNDEAIISRIAKLIQQGKRETASLIYSKSSVENSWREEKIKRIVSHSYQLSNVPNILDFITSEVYEPRQISIWLDVLLETMKTNDHLASIEGLHLKRVTKRFVTNFQALKMNEDYLEPLSKRIEEALIEPTKRLVEEWAESIQSGYDGPIITIAIEYPLTFDSIIGHLIPEALNNLKNGSETSFFEMSKKTMDFINQIPWMTTTVDALVHFKETLNTIDPNLKRMSEGIMFAYAVKNVASNVAIGELPLQYQKKLTDLTNEIPLSVQKLVWNPHVFIYKRDEPKNGMTKFISSNKLNIDNSNKRLTQFNETDTTNEGSKWILEPVNYADRFRIKNKESGEYLYSDDNSSLDGFPNKRSVFTYKLDSGDDINNIKLGDRTVWMLTPVNSTKGDGFLIMNLHWKEYLDSQDTPVNEIYTWKNESNPPESARHWIISDGISTTKKSDFKGKRLVCFFDSLATEREGAGKFTADKIDTSKCTHLVYSTAKIDDTTFSMTIGNEKIDITDKGYEKVLALKKQNPELKVMIHIGEPYIKDKYQDLFTSPDRINTFVKSALDFLQTYQFDGIHFDLQDLIVDRKGVTSLFTALNESFTGKNYLLSATVSPYGFVMLVGYDVPLLNKILDFIGIRTYDFHGYAELEVYHHSPLFHREEDVDVPFNANADYAIRALIDRGASPSKILLGIPFFGNSWAVDFNDTDPLSRIKDEAAPGKLTKSYQRRAYYEICDATQKDDWQVFQSSDKLMGPYAVSPIDSNNSRVWVGYDDPAMVAIKANYILTKELGGAYVWDISQDDFQNTCGGGINPMLTAITSTFEATRTTNSKEV